MEKSEIDHYVLESKVAAKEKIEAHITRLYELESLYGFDLDVATDIYGAHLLDADDTYSQHVIQRWHELLSLLRLHPGQPLWIVQPHKKLVDQCYGFGAKEEYTDHTFLTYVTGATIEAIDYVRASEDAPTPSILIPATTIQLDGSWGRKRGEDLEPKDILTLAEGQSYGNGVRWFDATPAQTGVMTFHPDSTLIFLAADSNETALRLPDGNWGAIATMREVEESLQQSA